MNYFNQLIISKQFHQTDRFVICLADIILVVKHRVNITWPIMNDCGCSKLFSVIDNHWCHIHSHAHSLSRLLLPCTLKLQLHVDRLIDSGDRNESTRRANRGFARDYYDHPNNYPRVVLGWVNATANNAGSKICGWERSARERERESDAKCMPARFKFSRWISFNCSLQ